MPVDAARGSRTAVAGAMGAARGDRRAAPRSTREVPVGGAAIGFFLGQRLSPALTDAMMSLRRVAVDAQRTDRPDNGTDTWTSPGACAAPFLDRCSKAAPSPR
jgi:hypothetical protein